METQIKQTISQLTKELSLLRSFVIGLSGRDLEGSYRPEFVKKILSAISDEAPYEFKGAKDFLTRLQNKS